MAEIKIWALTALVIVTASIVGWVVRTATMQILKALRSIKEELEKLNENIIRQEQQILHLQETTTDHEQRIRVLEQQKA